MGFNQNFPSENFFSLVLLSELTAFMLNPALRSVLLPWASIDFLPCGKAMTTSGGHIFALCDMSQIRSGVGPISLREPVLAVLLF